MRGHRNRVFAAWPLVTTMITALSISNAMAQEEGAPEADQTATPESMEELSYSKL